MPVPNEWGGPPIKRIIILDHFDSFTYNLVQVISDFGAHALVYRTDRSISDVVFSDVKRLVFSPGPGHPRDVALFSEMLEKHAGKIPILGVCLGHQAIALAAGAEVVRNYRQMHGKTSLVHHSGHELFAGMPNPFEACRYHSLVVGRQDAEDHGLEVIAWTAEGEVMAVASKQHKNLFGVQFHPESIFTPEGGKIIENFLEL